MAPPIVCSSSCAGITTETRDPSTALESGRHVSPTTQTLLGRTTTAQHSERRVSHSFHAETRNGATTWATPHLPNR